MYIFFNFTFPLRCFRLPKVEDHCFRQLLEILVVTAHYVEPLNRLMNVKQLVDRQFAVERDGNVENHPQCHLFHRKS
jgi:hypothetical protein